jgi:hypothetical protein
MKMVQGLENAGILSVAVMPLVEALSKASQ